MRVFLNAIIIQVLLSLYIYWRGWQALPDKKLIKIPYSAIFIIELAIYFVGFFTSSSGLLGFEALHDLAWVGTTWMIFAIYMTVLLLIYDLVRYIDKKKKILPKSLDLQTRKPKLIYFCSALLLVIGVMSYGSYRFYNPVVTEMNLTVNKDASSLKNLRIVVATDIHAGYLIDKNMISMYVDKIMEQKPDIILLVGDIIDYDVRSLYEQRMETEFLRLKAPYGVYASTGNHEYIQLDEAKDEKILWLSQKAGFTVLRDTTVLVANSFYLVGREDDKCLTRKSLAEIMRDVDKDKPVIVMNHEPHRLNEESEAGADIAVYGHTHYGQFFPNNTIMAIGSTIYNTGIIPEDKKLRFMYELPFGYKKKDNTHIYVSSGLGLAGPQFRIGTISEIVVLNVTFTQSN
ncbi:putative MPP superfamily phosphohydrolase [Dysgonomonas sp. PFB1-18]|uniref:metallophosphoesterase n=1 Tax=unclassified Dysgonomonas TaxID=2630389 RepID=UPI002476FC8A|nr:MULTISPECIES: metallophosphoesterase [unclassified Dysgonomonas]MDH6308225.1 putative MPP superfamily phosphohydrolase [Dysgonomonas sp. PF1-14]MDH6338336.1 putative MPP superfamily phosphohydrolase [Dysgonomonas sp. PF1-16]MDH6379833.1 putative MPP superfamily phosphohydrolase [Dysgonomonas sp. PFB1-18]MDH6397077.1 putative MPP superfamily phosphohydrolase [Dysgonomonas sp. PF1-23]